MSVAWYRLRATLSRRWGGYLAIVLLTGLVGGLAMGSLAAARTTASSFTTFWASTNPSDLVGADGLLNPLLGDNSGYQPALIKKIAGLPHVKAVESQAGIDFLPLQADGAPLNAPNFYPPAAGNGYGSVDGLYFDQDKVAVAQGRMADPRDPDQLMLSAEGASALDVHVGSVLPVGIYTNAQTQLPAFGTATVKPMRVVDEKVVGIAVFNDTIVEDDVDQSSSPNNLLHPRLDAPAAQVLRQPFRERAYRWRAGPAISPPSSARSPDSSLRHFLRSSTATPKSWPRRNAPSSRKPSPWERSGRSSPWPPF